MTAGILNIPFRPHAWREDRHPLRASSALECRPCPAHAAPNILGVTPGEFSVDFLEPLFGQVNGKKNLAVVQRILEFRQVNAGNLRGNASTRQESQ